MQKQGHTPETTEQVFSRLVMGDLIPLTDEQKAIARVYGAELSKVKAINAELLEACKKMLEALEGEAIACDEFELMLKAVSKAEGRAE